jgi:methylated-DNA-[protein]-cysteine S-methyltransferase
MPQLHVSFFQTPFGVGKVWGTAEGIHHVDLPSMQADSGLSQSSDIQESESIYTKMAAEQLFQYFYGALKLFSLPLDLSGYSNFQQDVLRETAKIPFGEVISYGELARRAARPGAARAVGGVMACNRIPIIIPCHRVVAATGALTGFTAPGGIEMKKRLLMMEHADFMDESRVSVN